MERVSNRATLRDGGAGHRAGWPDSIQVLTTAVKKHLDNIYRKLAVTNRVAAVKTALELHLGG
jgi:hypothetical protein